MAETVYQRRSNQKVPNGQHRMKKLKLVLSSLSWVDAILWAVPIAILTTSILNK